MSIKKQHIFDIIYDSNILSDRQKSLDKSVERVKSHYNLDLSHELHADIISSLENFLKKLKLKWDASHRILAKFIEKNGTWLQTNLLTDKLEPLLHMVPPKTKSNEGRPRKEWHDLSKRQQRRRARETLDSHEPNELIFTAAQGSYKKDNDLKFVLNYLISSPADSSTNVRHLLTKGYKPQSFTSEEALALMVDTNISKEGYQTLRSSTKRKNLDIYPAYNHVREAKRKCYPGNIQITEESAKVPLQDLLDHTSLRIVEQEQTAIMQYLETFEEDKLNLTLISKWGFDGSSGHSPYKQKFDSVNASDESIFATTFVPLKLIDSNNNAIWHNPVPSSTRFCRPIHLQFKKESTELCKEEENLIESEIKELKPTQINLNITCANANPTSKQIEITYDLHSTMVDQKVINSLTGTSSTQRCYICGSTTKNFNNLDNFPEPKVENYKYGISPLHKWIRCFEMLLHISYKLEIKKWQARSVEEKSSVADRKKLIHDSFKDQLGLRVDEPRQGSGNSNDGNTARRAFQNESVFANICGLDEDLIHKFHIILIALQSKYPIDTDKFKTYCTDTGKLLVRLYPWYMMPTSIHVLLVHGPDIMSNSILPFGIMSEDAQESRNKDNKQFRLHHARKTSRTDNMSDVFHRLMVTGDIVISCSSLKTPKTRNVPTEIKQMLKNADNTDSDNTDSDSDSD